MTESCGKTGDVKKKSLQSLTSGERVRMDQAFSGILNEMKKHGLPDVALIRKAYLFAVRMHGGTRRRTGEPYIMHPLEVARILANAGHESDVIASSILHDVAEECEVSFQQLEEEFGAGIAETVNAVTNVSRLLAPDPEISKMDLDTLSDWKFLTEISQKNNRKAVYIKCADRIHNLRTIHIFPEEQQKAKACHTRNIIIPVARKLHINKMADILATLCLKIENPYIFSEISNLYSEMLDKNRDTLLSHEGLLLSTEKMVANNPGNGKYVAAFHFAKRSEDSIFMELSNKLRSIYDVKEAFTKKNVPLYDVYFIVRDSCTETPETVFFSFYNRMHESKYRFTITGIDTLDHSDITYYQMEDRYSNRYRLFIQSEREHLEFTHGIIVSEEVEGFRNGMGYINTAEPGEPVHRMIPVFKMDGTPMMIDEGATVLDFAFAINRNIGICARYAFLNGSRSQTPICRRLSPGDMVEVVSDHFKDNPAGDIPHATVRWFEYLHTREATKALSRWLEKHLNSMIPRILVYDGDGNEYEIEMTSTVLDFAFVVGEQAGLHIQKAFINKCPVPTALDRTLRYGDRVRFEFSPDQETPVFDWFRIVRTKLAKERLIAYFERKYGRVPSHT